MEISKIPFNEFISIKESEDKQTLGLNFRQELQNHLQTMHASAQFSLAEACSGLVLLQAFPELADTVVPVLRKAEIKFKSPAAADIYGKATISDEEKEKFLSTLTKKSRAIINVSVQIFANDTLTMIGSFEWFVQKM